VRGYRAPSFSVTKASLWALDVLIEEGHEYDASIFPIHHDRYGIPDAQRHRHVIQRPAGRIVEVPGSTTQVAGTNVPIAGGGYFRLLPYAWTRWGITRVNRIEREPVTFYLHPWEIDPQQPRFAVGPAAALRHYTGLSATHGRMERLLQDFRFDAIDAMLTERAPEHRSHVNGVAYAC
jgi:polysaccharide deacetylase family protein (PEP-CTERM system associated)